MRFTLAELVLVQSRCVETLFSSVANKTDKRRVTDGIQVSIELSVIITIIAILDPY